MKNEVPRTKFVSRCEECLHWEINHERHVKGAVSCKWCGYRPDEEAVFLTMEQFLAKYPKSSFAQDIRAQPDVNW